jgi:hypothetical protein
VEYFAVKFEATDGTKWLFAPYLVVDEAKLYTDGWDKGTWRMGSFYPVVVPGKQSVSVSYILFPESGLRNFSIVDLKPHKFDVTLLAWLSGKGQWSEAAKFMLDVDADMIASLKGGVMFQMPSVEQQQRVQSIK